MFTPIERRKVGEQIAAALREAIVGGRLAPGQTLPSERELATKYEVNRSSVREALLRLEAWGLVEIRQGGATKVRDFLVSAGLHVLPFLVAPGGRLDRGALADLHELRAMFLGWCAESAARKATVADVARLDGIARALADQKAKAAELQQLDYDFFEELVRITGNRLLALLANVVREVYMEHRERFASMYQRGAFDPAHHRRAVEAIRRKDAAGAAAAMRAHAESALAKEKP